MSDETFKILSIDGGGIRGIYPAKYLADLEDDIGEPICRYFDLITGTSTGGIIAIALGLEIPASQILELYRNSGEAIFGQPFHLGPLFKPKYRNQALLDTLISNFGELLLGDSKCYLCIPAIDLSTGNTKVYKTRHSDDLVTDWTIPAWKVAAATSAAPIFFPAFPIDDHDAKVDGGLWANNPSLVGVTEAFRLGHSREEIRVLSIGTGITQFHMDPATAMQAGLFQWFCSMFGFLRTLGLCKGNTLSELTLSVQSQAVDNQLNQFGLQAYKRINSKLPPNKFGLDTVKESPELEAFAQEKLQRTIVDIKRLFLSRKAANRNS